MLEYDPGRALTIAFVVLHTSPLDVPGTKDAGGMNVVVRAHAERLVARGHRVQLITRRSHPSHTEQPAEVELAPGLTAHHLDAGPPRVLAKGQHEQLIGEFGAALAAHLRAHPAHLIHAEHWYSGIAALPVAHALEIPLVQSFHSIAAADETPLAEGERAEAPGRLAGEQQLARSADLIITVSNAERQTAIDRLGAARDRVRVVPPGVDLDVFSPKQSDQSVDHPEVLTVGRLHPLKGFDLAIAAVAKIAPEYRPVLRIIGSPPPDGDDYAKALEAAVRAHGLQDSVVFEGALSREELAARLRAASLVLIPSHSETYGLVALEAAASGVAVIARAAGGLIEAVIDGETGALIESDDDEQAEAERWAHVIADLLADPARLVRMGQAGRESAVARNWDVSTELLESVYRELLDGRGQPSSR